MIDGKWQITITTPMGPRVATLDVQTSGGEAYGSLTSDLNELVQIQDGKYQDEELIYSALLNTPMGPADTTTRLRLAGNSLLGTISLSFGTFEVNGERIG